MVKLPPTLHFVFTSNIKSVWIVFVEKLMIDVKSMFPPIGLFRF